MFFVLSKTLSYLTQPFVVICLLLVVSFFVKRPKLKRGLTVSSFILLFVLSNDFIANEIVLWWEIPPTPYAEISKQYDFGIVLTGISGTDNGPDDRVYFGRGVERVTHTLQLYKLGIIKKIVISGGSGKLKKISKQEADKLADAFRLMGVPDSVLLIENKSRNTYESAVEVIKMLEPITSPDKCLLITSSYHLSRSRACYAREGWQMDMFSTDFISHKRRFSFDVLFIPKIDAIYQWTVLTKEWVGMVAYKMAGYI
ncbi:MAG: YdcF family protein [Cytophagales bacterium]